MKKILLIVLVFGFIYNGYSQNDTYEYDKKLSKENNELLKKLRQDEDLRLSRVRSYLTNNPNKERFYDYSNGGIKEIYDIIDGKPIFRVTDNLSAARGTKTTALQVGGSLGLNLDGSDITVGVWDGGPVQDTHPEFMDVTNTQSRVTIVDNVTVDGDTGFSSHGTHVTGTIGAKGVNASAMGMAPNIFIKSYNWTSDTSEMLQAVNDPVNPILLSNHSYGVPVDPNDGSGPIASWIMGAYNTDAQNLDALIQNNPQYLVLTSAGNAGSTSYPDGMLAGFDKLTTDKNAKNNLVVANANPTLAPFTYEISSLVINSSSSQGPTDDLRIKPDIAADGTNLFSTIPTDDYATFSGTSMSSPNAAGTIVLIQEYYKSLNSAFMIASTAKGLVCHTSTDDNANVGPDPRFGWGFLNALEAANVIADDNNGTAVIDELILDNGDSYSFTFSATAGDVLRASICWTDMPGAPLNGESNLNNPSPRLVNDLDLRITKDGQVYEPWKLDFSSGTAFTAVKGDNIVDNIEVIDIEAPETGVFTLTVTHKGTLQGNTGGPFDPQSQDFSLILTGNNISLSVYDNLFAQRFSVYPNPSNGEFTISYNSTLNASSEDMRLNIYDISGRLVYNNIYTNSSDVFKETIKLNHLNSGVYLAKISNGINIFTQKLIIH